MDETFLHFLWQYQKFSTADLKLTDGSKLIVFHTGTYNEDAGPDFTDARIKIDNIQWVGKVEIHLRSSDWIHHKHHKDRNYDNVVLHVVWNHDKEIKIQGSPIPTLALKSIVDPSLISLYQDKLPGRKKMPCSAQIGQVDAIFIQSMLERAGIERLRRKADQIIEELQLTNNDWDEITYRRLAANFGFSTNKPAFERLAQNLPFRILKKELHNNLSCRALLWGQAGFLQLNRMEADQLRNEYQYQQRKYSLARPLPLAIWKFGKLRPANAPTTRLDQFAGFLSANPRPLSLFLKSTDSKNLISLIQSRNSSSNAQYPPLGKMSAENILFNSVATLLAAYSRYVDDQQYMDRAISILEELKPENNRITKVWPPNLKARNAFQSQAQMELISNYCFKRRCLRCSIGVKLLNG